MHQSARILEPLVIGIDAGGTSTRCVVVSESGKVVARGRGAGANINSSTADPADSLAAALRGALAEVPTDAVATGVFGIAGAGSAGRERAAAAATSAWRRCGLPGVPEVVTDIVVAFAAGTTSPYGTVLIAGTGAVAAAVWDGVVIRRCDGYGWLLGDEGSGVWLGREGLRAALAAWDGRGAPTVLAATVPRALLGSGRPEQASDLLRVLEEIGAGPAGGEPESVPAWSAPRGTREAVTQSVIATVYGRAPADLGRLAPVVTAAAQAGDPVAAGICATAASRLVAAVDAVRVALPGDGPIVLAGSVLGSGPVAEAVRCGLGSRGVGSPVVSRDGALGAAGLALRRLGATPSSHAALLA